VAVALGLLAINVRYYEDPVERPLALVVGIVIVVLAVLGFRRPLPKRRGDWGGGGGGDDDHHDSTHCGHGGGDGAAHGGDGGH
jgi:hypothetical protein